MGDLSIDSEGAKLFFQLIDIRYEKRSTTLISNHGMKFYRAQQ
ncbi:TPA: hypothetical protein ACGCJB_002081 [Bacillus cereus]